MSSNHDEEANGGSEQVGGPGIVHSDIGDLGCHVAQSTENCSMLTVTISALNHVGEAEVSDLEVEVSVEEQVFGLEVSVHDAFVVAELQTVEQLVEVETSSVLVEGTRHGDDVEHLAGLGKFEGDVVDPLLAGRLVVDVLAISKD